MRPLAMRTQAAITGFTKCAIDADSTASRWTKHYEDVAEIKKSAEIYVEVGDMYESIKTIEERSKGLLNFVSTYKNLTRIPTPQFQHIKVKDILNHVSVLMKKVLDKNDIELETRFSTSDIEIYADQDLIQQVLINLMVNAKEAIQQKKSKKIHLAAMKKNG